MNTLRTQRYRYAAVALCLMFGYAAAPQAAVVLDPTVITVDSPDQVVKLRILKDGVPVPVANVGEVRLLVDDHDYREMFTYHKEDDVLVLKPTSFLQVGSYQLVVDTPDGPATAMVYTPLSDMPTIVEKLAIERNLTEDEAKRILHLVTTPGRERVTINLPPVYYEGQTLNLEMPYFADRHYRYAVNGKVVMEGLGQNKLAYTFNEPGTYVLNYSETKNGATIAETSAVTRVVGQPAIRYTKVIPTGEVWRMPGPDGYERYVWKVNGDTISTDRVVEYRVVGDGAHTIELYAYKGPTGYRHYTYLVNPKDDVVVINP